MGSGQQTTTAGSPSPVRSAYLVGLEGALHIAQQETTKSDILAAIRRRIDECDPDRCCGPNSAPPPATVGGVA